MAPSSASELGHSRGGPGVKGCAFHSALPAKGVLGDSDEGVAYVGLGELSNA